VSGLLELAEEVVARALPGEGLEAYAARGVETEIRVYEGNVESLTSASSAGIGVRIVTEGAEGYQVGFAWAGSLEASAIDRALFEARANAEFSTPDPSVGLAEPDGVTPATISLRADSIEATSTDAKIALAQDLELRTRTGDPRIRQVDSADYADHVVETAIASTTGVRGLSERSSAYLSVSAIAGGADDTQTGSGYCVGRGPDDLSIEEAAQQAIERSVRMLGAVKAPSARLTAVFDPRVTSTLLSVIGQALSGEAVVKGRSFFEGRLGELVAHPTVTLVDDPTVPEAFTAATFDGEGLACRRNVLIEGGSLRGFVYDTAAARRAGVKATGSAMRGGYAGRPVAGCRALLLAPGSQRPEEILASVGEGLYVQAVTGVHSGVSPVSGDFSVGVDGLMIRGGELAEPVREVTVASTLQAMLLAISAIGSDLTYLPGVAAGMTLAISEMQLSGS
jgi:PmbA protein